MKYGIGLAEAFRTLTVFPFPGKNSKKPSNSLFFYPAVGVFLGFLSTYVVFLLSKSGNMQHNSLFWLLTGCIYVFLMAVFTRCFHLDGLGDTADGFGSSWNKEKILSVMKDSRSGSFAVVSICTILLIKAVSASLLFSSEKYGLVFISVVISRTLVVFACSFSKYAKENGLSFNLVSHANAVHTVVSFVIFSAISFECILLNFFSIKQILLTFSFSFISLLLILFESKRKIGGITGDVLGACAEITETVALVAACFV